MDTSTPAPRKQITLSPETLDAIALPLTVGPTTYRDGTKIFDANGGSLAIVLGWETNGDQDTEIATFIVALVNATLALAAPVVTIIPETTTELRQLNDHGYDIAEELARR